jgi:hypothetical protein
VLHALFDKSFLQSLSEDESVWFDHFYRPIVCPIFYLETLADLAKAPDPKRSWEAQVKGIARKFPERTGTPCADHVSLAQGNLLGFPVPMTGQIPRSGARVVRNGPRTGLIYEDGPEATAFARWRAGQFEEVERIIAAQLRQHLTSLNLAPMREMLNSLGVTGKTVKTLEQAFSIAQEVVQTRNPKPIERLRLAVIFFEVPNHQQRRILARWEALGQQSLTEFAPYTAYALTLEIFFQVALAAGLLSDSRKSNRTDISYLFYLPFTHVFVSSDKLHRACAPFFLRTDQQFVWGEDLLEDLGRLNDYYLKFPLEQREKGLFSFARLPPTDGNFLTAQIYDRMSSSWRNTEPSPKMSEEESKAFIERANSLQTAQSEPLVQTDSQERYDLISIPHMVRRKKGSWWQVPKDLPDRPKGE